MKLNYKMLVFRMLVAFIIMLVLLVILSGVHWLMMYARRPDAPKYFMETIMGVALFVCIVIGLPFPPMWEDE